jgi:small conductance mechanosensitive channel
MNMSQLSKLSAAGDGLLDWTIVHGPKLIVLIILAYAISKFVFFSGRKIIHKTLGKNQWGKDRGSKQREETLVKVLEGTISVVFWIVLFLITLDNIGINVAPILATAGVVGIAIGLGSQYVIRDIISGFFIIIENHYRVGDMVCIGTHCGFVESMNLRLTKLRDQDGIVYHIPNSEIRISLNQSKVVAQCTLSMGVAYESDIEKIVAVIDRIGTELALDEAWKDAVIAPPHFVRIDGFTDLAMIIKVQGPTRPLKQFEVTAELRKRLKIAFDAEGILMPHTKTT